MVITYMKTKLHKKVLCNLINDDHELIWIYEGYDLVLVCDCCGYIKHRVDSRDYTQTIGQRMNMSKKSIDNMTSPEQDIADLQKAKKVACKLINKKHQFNLTDTKVALKRIYYTYTCTFCGAKHYTTIQRTMQNTIGYPEV